jgi:predicted metal-dependent peptidase
MKSYDEAITNMFFNPGLQEYLFYAHMIGQCKIIAQETLQSPAAVSFNLVQYELYINELEFSKYTLLERLFILKHEMLHILNDHISRGKDKHHMTWNIATDCAINQLCNPLHMPMHTQERINELQTDNPPQIGDPMGILPVNLKKYLKPGTHVKNKQNAEYYYNLLITNAEKKPNDSNDSNGSNDSNDSNSLTIPNEYHSHEKWGSSSCSDSIHSQITANMIEKAIINTSKSRADLPKDISIILEYFKKEPELNWKTILKNIVGERRTQRISTIKKRDRRYPHRLDLKGKVKDRKFNLLIVSDISGSMSNNDVKTVWSEVVHICGATNTSLDLIQVDSIAREPEKITRKTTVLERKGTGGTYLASALHKAKEYNITFDAIVITTDGYVSSDDINEFLKTNKKIIWLLAPDTVSHPKMNTSNSRSFILKGQI